MAQPGHSNGSRLGEAAVKPAYEERLRHRAVRRTHLSLLESPNQVPTPILRPSPNLDQHVFCRGSQPSCLGGHTTSLSVITCSVLTAAAIAVRARSSNGDAASNNGAVGRSSASTCWAGTTYLLLPSLGRLETLDRLIPLQLWWYQELERDHQLQQTFLPSSSPGLVAAATGQPLAAPEQPPQQWLSQQHNQLMPAGSSRPHHTTATTPSEAMPPPPSYEQYRQLRLRRGTSARGSQLARLSTAPRLPPSSSSARMVPIPAPPRMQPSPHAEATASSTGSPQPSPPAARLSEHRQFP